MRRLDPDVRRLLDELDQRTPAAPGSTKEELQAQFLELIGWLNEGRDTAFDGAVREWVVPAPPQGSVPVRSYEPHGHGPGSGPAEDTVVLFHGGGWVLGGCDSADANARLLATRLGARVVSVDYRLAPDHPFPAPYEDCVAVVDAVAAERPRWLAVAGDSAGGNLAAAVACARRRIVDAQLLVYPALDALQSLPSVEECGSGYLLTREDMASNWNAYAGGTAYLDARLSPLAESDLTGLPPAVVVTAGLDPLRDDGAQYAERLRTAGVPVRYLEFPTLIHAFVEFSGRVPAAGEATEAFLEVFADLRDAAVRRQAG